MIRELLLAKKLGPNVLSVELLPCTQVVFCVLGQDKATCDVMKEILISTFGPSKLACATFRSKGTT